MDHCFNQQCWPSVIDCQQCRLHLTVNWINYTIVRELQESMTRDREKYVDQIEQFTDKYEELAKTFTETMANMEKVHDRFYCLSFRSSRLLQYILSLNFCNILDQYFKLRFLSLMSTSETIVGSSTVSNFYSTVKFSLFSSLNPHLRKLFQYCNCI